MNSLERDILVLRSERQQLLDERSKIDTHIAAIEEKISILEQSILDDVSIVAKSTCAAGESVCVQNKVAAMSSIVTESGSLKEKFELFCSLFAGRRDVFARGYRGSDGKIGYSPVCINLFNSKICAKSRDNDLKTKRSNCKHQYLGLF